MIELDTDLQLLSDKQDHDIIPLISEEDEKAIHNSDLPETLPLLALRNTSPFSVFSVQFLITAPGAQ